MTVLGRETAAIRWSDIGAPGHFAQFYESDSALVDVLTDFVGSAIESGAAAVVICARDRIVEAERRWTTRGLDVEALRASGRYAGIDAMEALDGLLVDGWPDEARFTTLVEPRIAAPLSRGARVVVFDEMVGLLCARGRHDAAARVEDLWCKLAARHAFALCCAYPMAAMTTAGSRAMQDVFAHHSVAVSSESCVDPSGGAEPLEDVRRLQQRACHLEAEIERRTTAEAALARRERELSDLLDNGPYALHSVGADGTILWANACELAMLGYRADEYVGQHVSKFYVDENVCACILRRLADGETLRDEPAELRAKDGSIQEVRISSNAHFEDGALVRTRCLTRDVTTQMRTERALSETEARAQQTGALLAAIVASSDDAIISKSLDGRISSWNDGAARLFGYTAEEAIGRPVTIVIPPELQHEEQDILAKLARGERIDHFETVRVAKDGRRIDVSLTISPVRDAAGRVVGASKVARDVTERRRLEEKLREADRRKDEFIAMLGHELRNPLAPIRNVAEVLRRTVTGNDECDRLCRMLERQVQQMTRLLDDLLDVGRITQGKIKFHREPVDVAAVVQRAVEASRPTVDSRRHELRVSVPKTPFVVDGDAARLVQMLTNLLNNAAKYTPDGGRIALRVVQRADRVEIRVRDNGAGISSEMLPRIFDLFVQADATDGKPRDGLGIGLTLVRVIAEHHGGSVRAKSAGAGRGSEFVVELPATRGVSRSTTAVACAIDSAAARKRIVIVDDNRDASQSLATLLRLSGHDVVVATDGASALDVVQRLRPDLALLDIGLPGMSGYEVARRLRASGCTVPLAAITGYGAAEDRQRSRDAGFDHHFVKPIDPIALEQLIASPNPAAQPKP